MLEAIQLTKYYGDKLALDRLDLRIDDGEIFCLLGSNGAGKTTTIKLFLGFIEPTSGQALLDGRPPGSSQRVAYIPENLSLYPNLSGMENLRFFSRLAGRQLSKVALEEHLLTAGLQPEFMHRRAETYSKGMRQKVGIAIALSQQARALLLDEPTSGLDPRAAYEFGQALHRLRAGGTSVLMTTHDLFRAKEVADRIGIMREGRLQAVLDPAEVGHQELERRYLDVISAESGSVGERENG